MKPQFEADEETLWELNDLISRLNSRIFAAALSGLRVEVKSQMEKDVRQPFDYPQFEVSVYRLVKK